MNRSPNRARGGTATASSELPGLNAYEAFTGVVSYWDSWAAAGTDLTAWIVYDFGAGVGRQIETIKIYGQQQNYPSQCRASLRNSHSEFLFLCQRASYQMKVFAYASLA